MRASSSSSEMARASISCSVRLLKVRINVLRSRQKEIVVARSAKSQLSTVTNSGPFRKLYKKQKLSPNVFRSRGHDATVESTGARNYPGVCSALPTALAKERRLGRCRPGGRRRALVVEKRRFR